jgi:hypothetical protein
MADVTGKPTDLLLAKQSGSTESPPARREPVLRMIYRNGPAVGGLVFGVVLGLLGFFHVLFSSWQEGLSFAVLGGLLGSFLMVCVKREDDMPDRDIAREVISLFGLAVGWLCIQAPVKVLDTSKIEANRWFAEDAANTGAVLLLGMLSLFALRLREESNPQAAQDIDNALVSSLSTLVAKSKESDPDVISRHLELVKLEYEHSAERYENIYKAIWQQFQYIALSAGAIGALSKGDWPVSARVFVTLTPLIFWVSVSFLPMDFYGNALRGRLKKIEATLSTFGLASMQGLEPKYYGILSLQHFRRYHKTRYKWRVAEGVRVWFVVIFAIWVFAGLTELRRFKASTAGTKRTDRGVDTLQLELETDQVSGQGNLLLIKTRSAAASASGAVKDSATRNQDSTHLSNGAKK